MAEGENTVKVLGSERASAFTFGFAEKSTRLDFKFSVTTAIKANGRMGFVLTESY